MNLVQILTGAGIPHALAWGGLVMAIASALAAILPHPAPTSVWALPRNFLDTLACNWGRAANATPPATGGGSVPLAALLLLALPLGGCNLAQMAALVPALGPATTCALDLAGAAEAHASSTEPDAMKALGIGSAALVDPQCQATLLALAAATKG